MGDSIGWDKLILFLFVGKWMIFERIILDTSRETIPEHSPCLPTRLHRT